MRNSLVRLTRLPVMGPLISLILVSVVVGLTTNRFWIPDNLNNLALQASIVAIVGIGSTLVILTGGIDLSPGSAIALLTMIMAQLIKTNGIPIPEAIVIVLVLSALMGAFNGLLASYGRIPSFIVTLATMNIFRGIAFLFNNGSPIFSVSPSLEPLFYGKVFGVALPLFYVLIFYALAWAFLQYTPTGRRIYAIGGNESAARLSGIDVHQTRFLAFVFAGLMAGIGSVLMTARLNSGSPNYGVGTELQAIGAAVVGGASLAGGYATHRGHDGGSADHCRCPERSQLECGANLLAEYHPRSDHRAGGSHRHVAIGSWPSGGTLVRPCLPPGTGFEGGSTRGAGCQSHQSTEVAMHPPIAAPDAEEDHVHLGKKAGLSAFA